MTVRGDICREVISMAKSVKSKWKCPKCGREFARTEQPHYCGKPQTVDEYIEAQECILA